MFCYVFQAIEKLEKNQTCIKGDLEMKYKVSIIIKCCAKIKETHVIIRTKLLSWPLSEKHVTEKCVYYGFIYI